MLFKSDHDTFKNVFAAVTLGIFKWFIQDWKGNHYALESQEAVMQSRRKLKHDISVLWSLNPKGKPYRVFIIPRDLTPKAEYTFCTLYYNTNKNVFVEFASERV